MISLKNPGRGLVLSCSRSKTRVGGLCCRVRSQKLSVFSLKNSDRVPCGRSQKPGSGFGVDRVHSQKPWEGFCYLARSQKPWGVLCRPCSLSKTRVGGLCSLSKTRVGGFLLPCLRSKSLVWGFCYRVRSQKLPVFSLKNSDRVPCGRSQQRWSGFGVVCVLSQKVGGFVLPCSLSKTRVGGFVLVLFSLKNPGRGFGVDRVHSQKPW